MKKNLMKKPTWKNNKFHPLSNLLIAILFIWFDTETPKNGITFWQKLFRMCFDFIEKGFPLDLHNKHLLEKYKIQGMLDVMNESESGKDAERSVQKLIKEKCSAAASFPKISRFSNTRRLFYAVVAALRFLLHDLHEQHHNWEIESNGNLVIASTIFIASSTYIWISSWLAQS